MIQYLTRRGFVTKREKEVFDILKTDQGMNRNENETEGEKMISSNNEPKSDSGVSADCEDQYEGCGVSVYSLGIEKGNPAEDVVEDNDVHKRNYENVTKTSEIKDCLTNTHVDHPYENSDFQNKENKHSQCATTERAYQNCWEPVD